MDLIFSRYNDPMQFIHLYIEQGRFGEFVENIINLDYERKKEEAKKDDDNKLWLMYINSGSETSFNQWKAEVLMNTSNESATKHSQKTQKSLQMTDEEVQEQIDDARSILKCFKL